MTSICIPYALDLLIPFLSHTDSNPLPNAAMTVLTVWIVTDLCGIHFAHHKSPQGEMASPRQSMASIASMGSYQVGPWWLNLVSFRGYNRKWEG